MQGLLIQWDEGHSDTAKGAMGLKDEQILNKVRVEALYRYVRLLGGTSKILPNGPTAALDRSIPVAEANKIPNSLFYSVHHNAHTTPLANGYETLVYPTAYSGKTKELVDKSHEAYRIIAQKYGLADRGIKKQDVQVLRTTKMPAALIECGFVSSKKDMDIITNLHFVEESSLALAKAIMGVAGQPIIPQAPQPTLLTSIIQRAQLQVGTYLIASKATGRFLTEDTTNNLVQTYQFLGSKNQEWDWDGEHFISRHSGMFLDVLGGGFNQGALLQTYPGHGKGNQSFNIGTNGEIEVSLTNQLLDIREGEDRNGATVIQWKGHGKANQLWHFIRLPKLPIVR